MLFLSGLNRCRRITAVAPGFEESWLAWSQIQRYHGQPHGAFGADEHLAGWGCGMVMVVEIGGGLGSRHKVSAACEIDLCLEKGCFPISPGCFPWNVQVSIVTFYEV